ncbi:hypothetical protein [Clostridium botulinum]|uniref:Uncharacterized protein n=1 Tax=Clostridium botulinum TaxID=1491 RepID=A0A9Q1UWV4_CLOBO|nr:hypothetical protein [Clostridium botulinum]KEI01375.1 hypothetical protein Y848_09380 [Clostridium botulinum C/D str. Sp77]KEI02806.1 hypothetical protein Z953_06270 [Clostridium botulinum D str. 16868]KLU76207.1 hypothetical protein CBC3_04800 [Clostridium botulinum V891]KOA72852.1 hypothetical protein ADU77_14310 [Clostridium botulinum]KOA74592.1 hypothetical protein ADU78_10225 [Clostridium botulinum]
MYINSEARLLAQLNDYSVGKSNDLRKPKCITENDIKDKNIYRDSIDISTHSSKLATCSPIDGFGVDKGTAANTTIYVNKSTYNQILNYSTNNPNCHWDEMGFDEEKRWVVVNGQRFEYPLSKEEKEAIQRMKDKCNIFKVFEEEDKKRDKYKKHKKELNKVQLHFNENEKFNINTLGNSANNTKIKNLVKNDKVMKMLSDISAMNGGIGIELAVD